jgi:putative redox protein
MSSKTAVATLEGDGLRFAVTVGSGHTIVLDDGRGDGGPRPSEMLGAALAGCTAMDVVSILRKKRQVVTGYEVRVTGVQGDDHPHAFSRFEVLHVVDGPDLDPEAVRRAIELSATRYCAVGSTLSSGATELHHRYLLRGPGGESREADVLTTGPNVSPDALAAAAAG